VQDPKGDFGQGPVAAVIVVGGGAASVVWPSIERSPTTVFTTVGK
jgi:hypothetical protein